jgi:hypothetical protein
MQHAPSQHVCEGVQGASSATQLQTFELQDCVAHSQSSMQDEPGAAEQLLLTLEPEHGGDVVFRRDSEAAALAQLDHEAAEQRIADGRVDAPIVEPGEASLSGSAAVRESRANAASTGGRF